MFLDCLRTRRMLLNHVGSETLTANSTQLLPLSSLTVSPLISYSQWPTSKGGLEIKKWEWRVERRWSAQTPITSLCTYSERFLVNFYYSTEEAGWGLNFMKTVSSTWPLIWDKTGSKQDRWLWASHITTVYMILITAFIVDSCSCLLNLAYLCWNSKLSGGQMLNKFLFFLLQLKTGSLPT